MMNEKININSADATGLKRIPLIGDRMAAKIVAHRETVGTFNSIDELTAVRGISPNTIAEIRPFITVSSEAQENAEFTKEDATTSLPEQVVRDDIDDPFVVSELAFEEQASNGVDPPLAAEPPQLQPPTLLEHLITAVIGGGLGVVGTLLILYALNGALFFNTRSENAILLSNIANVQSTAEANQGAIRGGLEALNERVSIVATGESETAVDIANNQSQISEIEASIEDIETTVNSTEAEFALVQEAIRTTEERVDNLAQTSETLDAFLVGLQSLLLELNHIDDEISATETPVATVVPTEAVTTPEAPGSIRATRTPRPTRTPRATSTPIVLPTQPPEQQP